MDRNRIAGPWYELLDPFDMIMLDLWPMELLEHYLGDMEDFLEAESQKHHENIETIIEKIRSGELTTPLDPGQMPPAIEYDHHRTMMLEQFANILRKSFFTNLYTCLESRLTEECYLKDKNWRSAVPQKYCKNDVLTQAMQYLIRVQHISFTLGESKEWGELQGCRRLRNCIVHNEGRLNNQYLDKDELEKYISGKPSLSLSGDEIIFSRDFCEEALDTMGRFLVTVLVASRSWLSKQAE